MTCQEMVLFKRMLYSLGYLKEDILHIRVWTPRVFRADFLVTVSTLSAEFVNNFDGIHHVLYFIQPINRRISVRAFDIDDRETLPTLPTDPDVVVKSGKGFHVYYKEITTTDTRSIYSMNCVDRRFGSPSQCKKRIPYTVNTKYGFKTSIIKTI